MFVDDYVYLKVGIISVTFQILEIVQKLVKVGMVINQLNISLLKCI